MIAFFISDQKYSKKQLNFLIEDFIYKKIKFYNDDNDIFYINHNLILARFITFSINIIE
jgi:hypothetical protein